MILRCFYYRIELSQVIGGLLLGNTTDLTNENDALGFRILDEHIQAIDEICAVERITANAHAQCLAKTHLGGLMHGLIGQSARSRDDADLAALVYMAGHNADFALQRQSKQYLNIRYILWNQFMSQRVKSVQATV